jgi:phosphohistidine phosphatase SixA
MTLQQMRHTKLWLAAEAGNWPLAGYEIKELGEGFDDVVKFHPTHEDSPVAPKDAIPRIITGPMNDVRAAVEKKDVKAFETTYDALTTACNDCHQATNFGFNRVQRPTANPYPNQVFAPANAQSASTADIVNALRQGGYVIVMRHASSPNALPDKSTADPGNVKLERQLDDVGRMSATAMGQTLRDLKIPIGAVDSSPTYRALETIRLAGLTNPKTYDELGDNGRSMQGGTAAQAAWLQKAVTDFPKGTNTLIVTHLPNLTGAFPQEAAGAADGEALVFGPAPTGGARLVARIKIEEWPRMR